MSVAPDLAEEIVGWRAWYVKLRGSRVPVLYSVNRATPWPYDRWLVAECPHREMHPAPGDRCSCGIYAAQDRDQLDDLGYAAPGGTLIVIGEAGLAGRVVVGDQGWRAEKARVRRLLVPFEHWEYVNLLGNAYNIPVELAVTHGPREVYTP